MSTNFQNGELYRSKSEKKAKPKTGKDHEK